MIQISEDCEEGTRNSISERRESEPGEAAANSTVYVYGHGPTRNPFYEEARALHATAEGAVLILTACVSRGQKLLLMNGIGQEPVEAQVVRAQTLDAQMFELEVRFSVPQPKFWAPAAQERGRSAQPEKRQHPRVSLPRGISIAWQGPEQHDISRVMSLSAGGLFIESAVPARRGEILRLHFDLPGGSIRGKAVVRWSMRGRGMGVEFTELPEGSRAVLNALLQKLLGQKSNRK